MTQSGQESRFTGVVMAMMVIECYSSATSDWTEWRCREWQQDDRRADGGPLRVRAVVEWEYSIRPIKCDKE